MINCLKTLTPIIINIPCTCIYAPVLSGVLSVSQKNVSFHRVTRQRKEELIVHLVFHFILLHSILRACELLCFSFTPPFFLSHTQSMTINVLYMYCTSTFLNLSSTAMTYISLVIHLFIRKCLKITSSQLSCFVSPEFKDFQFTKKAGNLLRICLTVNSNLLAYQLLAIHFLCIE